MPTIGVVSTGELGAALGARFRNAGERVVTTLAGRSPASAELCRAAGIEPLGSLADVLAAVDVFVSCVPPAHAVRLAEDVASLRRGSSRTLLYVDCNSVAPRTVQRAAAALQHTGLTFVDASLHGTAARLADLSILYASGPAAGQVVDLFRPVVATESLGGTIGQASAFKMLLGAFSKSLSALMVEVGGAAARLELLDPYLGACRKFYPGLVDGLDRIVPGLPRHALRRADEVGEATSLWHELGLEPRILEATRRVLLEFAAENGDLKGDSMREILARAASAKRRP
jgi:hypothetical protein